MEYKTKVVINGTDITSVTSDSQPYITGVQMSDSVSKDVFAFGATGSSELKFTIVNPNVANLDGKSVEFWVSLIDEAEQSTFDKIYEEVGDTENDEYVIDDDVATDDEEDDGSEGDDMSAAEIAAADAEITADESNAFTLMNGEDDVVTSVTTEEEEEPEWIKVGVFYVYKQSEFNGQISVICYDGFSLMTDIYEPTTATGTIASLYADYCTKVYATYGITVDSSYPMPSGTITWNESISYRDAIGRFASLCGGYADFDENGQLNINGFVNSDVIIASSDLLSSDTNSGGEVVITGLACNGLVSGEIATLSFDNPYMTQTILDGILATYKGARVTGKSMSVMWEPGIEAGMFVRVMTDDECMAYLKMLNYAESEGYDDDIKASLNAFGSTVQIVSQVISFNGDAIATINSGLSTFAEVDNPSPTPVKKQAEDSAKTATSYITDIDEENGIKVSAKDNANNYVQINSNGMGVYKDSDGNVAEVANFGETSAIYGENANLIMSSNAISLADKEGSDYFRATVPVSTTSEETETFNKTKIIRNTVYRVTLKNNYSSLSLIELAIVSESPTIQKWSEPITSETSQLTATFTAPNIVDFTAPISADISSGGASYQRYIKLTVTGTATGSTPAISAPTIDASENLYIKGNRVALPYYAYCDCTHLSPLGSGYNYYSATYNDNNEQASYYEHNEVGFVHSRQTVPLTSSRSQKGTCFKVPAGVSLIEVGAVVTFQAVDSSARRFALAVNTTSDFVNYTSKTLCGTIVPGLSSTTYEYLSGSRFISVNEGDYVYLNFYKASSSLTGEISKAHFYVKAIG